MWEGECGDVGGESVGMWEVESVRMWEVECEDVGGGV